jgi:AraC-like DNA-binding protein
VINIKGLNQQNESYLRYLGSETISIGNRQSCEIGSNAAHSFGFVMDNTLTVTFKNGKKRASATMLSGELFFTPHNRSYTVTNNADRISRLVLLRFQSGGGRSEGGFPMPEEKDGLPGLRHFRLPLIRAWIQDFLDGSDYEDDPSLYYRRLSHLYGMAAAFVKHVRRPQSVNDDLFDYVERTRQYMLEQYAKPVDIEEVARLSGVSPNRFYQAFRKSTGLTPNKFMTVTRLNVSLGLLAAPDSSVSDAAHAVGYQDEFYFSRLFKKHMGLSPSDYSACARKRVANLSPVFQGDLSVLGIAPVLSFERGWSSAPEANLELIAQSNPDLILTSPVSDSIHRALSAIAPVVTLYWKRMSWKERLMQIGEALGLASVAERWLAYFDMKVDNAQFLVRQHMGDEPFLLVGAFEERFRLFGKQRSVLDDWFYDNRFEPDAEGSQQTAFHDTASLEEAAALDCDNVIFLVHSSLSDDFCLQLEEEWYKLKRSSPKRRCLFIRHSERLLYNAAVHESVIDQTVHRLLSPQMKNP